MYRYVWGSCTWHRTFRNQHLFMILEQWNFQFLWWRRHDAELSRSGQRRPWGCIACGLPLLSGASMPHCFICSILFVSYLLVLKNVCYISEKNAAKPTLTKAWPLSHYKGWKINCLSAMLSSVADPDPFDTDPDPDPAFQFRSTLFIWIRILLFNFVRVRIWLIDPDPYRFKEVVYL